MLQDTVRELMTTDPGADLLLASCVDGSSFEHADPPVTAIDLRPREAGAECARLLFDILAGHAERGTVRSQPIALIRRASTRG